MWLLARQLYSGTLHWNSKFPNLCFRTYKFRKVHGVAKLGPRDTQLLGGDLACRFNGSKTCPDRSITMMAAP